MADQLEMFDHFTRIADIYRRVRTTDEEPIRFIRDALAGRGALRTADVGCGEGRYDLLLFRYLPNLHLTCVDRNPEMLAQLARYLAEHGIANFETVVGDAEDTIFPAESLDCVFTFNAVHHFEFPTFIANAGRALKPDGQVFIYTRTPEQNARSIWGRHFPGFCETETRLFPFEQMAEWVEEVDGLRLIATKIFRFSRTASLGRLLDRARRSHYSTFSLYSLEEFDDACKIFEANVRRHFDDSGNIAWHDENVMLQIGR
jgi:SAM-dependent methyltransferase